MIYAFDGCKINTRLYTLQRLGETTRLRPKVFEVLIYLLEHRDRVVSKQELAENVWPNQFIADATLEGTISAIRQALGDSGRAQRLIQTLPSRGYRFIGQTTEHDDEATSDAVEAEASGQPEVPTQDAAEPAPAAVAPVEPAGGRCPTCQHVNAGDATENDQRCAACGRGLQPLCPRCGTANHPQANFCSSCGAALAAPLSTLASLSIDPANGLTPAPPMAPQATQGNHLEAERRQLTVMSCELVDAAALFGRLELEDLRDVTRTYHAMCADIAQRFGGYLAHRLGTKLLLYFGYPVAHEDDAQRAVQAGLDLIKALAALKIQLAQGTHLRLTMRLGIHTGFVVVEEQDEGARHETVVFGEPLTMAEQIQELAPSNAVVISAATAHLVQGYFVCQDIGPHRLKGMAEPIRLSRIIEVSEAQSRLDIVATSELTPFVGRDTEIALLLERWAQAKDGSGHVVLLSGEAGIGKSRLVQVMQEHLAEDAYTPLAIRCLPSSQNSALYPVIDAFHRWLRQWRQNDTPKEKLKKLETALAQYAIPLDETLPLLAALLSLPHPGDAYPPLQLTPQQQREQTLGAIVTVVLALAARQPVLVMVEDLHWVDPSTLELLTLIIDQTPAAPIYILSTFRPTFDVPWGNHSYLTHITLLRLPRSQVEQMVMHVTRGKRLPDALLQQVVDQTDGVPLFVEECIKSILETGLLRDNGDHYALTAPLPALTIPTTLHDSLMARLDRLDNAKSVAQLGATIGRQVPYALLRAVWQQDEAILQRELDRLVKAELVYQRGLRPQAIYVFKHALIQGAAYESLLKRTQQHYHQRIAQVLDEQFPETAALQPELLAHHYTEAGLPEQAVPYWQQAGEHAVERSANAEAVSHFTKGLEVLKSLPVSHARDRQELDLQLALGPSLRMIKGHTAPEVENAYIRAHGLCQLMGDNLQQFLALISLWRFYLNRGNILKACELAEQCFSVAQQMQDQVLRQDSHRMLGMTLLFLGKPILARTHLEQGIALYDPQQNHSRTFRVGMDAGVACLSWLAWTLWLLGYPDQALTRMYEALALAQESSHPYSLAFAMHHAAMLRLSRGEAQLGQELAEATMALAREHKFAQWSAGGMFTQGWALIEQDKVSEGIIHLQQAQAAWQSLGTELAQTHIFVRLAEAYGKIGQIKEGLRVLDKSLVIMNQHAECYYAAELYRLKGELLLAYASSTQRPQDPSYTMDEAVECFHQALIIARTQEAKSLELRAAMSFVRMYHQLGKQSDYRQILEELYNWFTEGLNNIDLQEANILLATS